MNTDNEGAPVPGVPLSNTDGFSTAVEITARLLEAGLVDAPGLTLEPDIVGGPSRRQGVSYQQSSMSDNDIAAWTIDVTSWADPAEVDWVDHLERLQGGLPLGLITGANWALTIREGQLDSDVPKNLADDVCALLPFSWVQWSWGHDADWFEPEFRSASEIIAELVRSGFNAEAVALAYDPGEYLTESLDDDTFVFFRVSAPGGPAATACAFIEEDVAEGAAAALDSYLGASANSSTIAGNGWVVRVISSEGLEFDADDYAQQIAEALGATYTSSSFVDVHHEGDAVDTSLWGPQAPELKAMLLWASRYIFAVPQEQWDDARLAAWNRIVVAAGNASRTAGIEQATHLMEYISTNDFFDHTGVEALNALAMRDLIAPGDYDTFTLPWRTQVGRIHQNDAEVRLRWGNEAIDKHAISRDGSD